MAAGYLTLGQVAGAHGVRGWVRVNSFTDPVDALLDQPQWRLQCRDGRELEVELLDGDCHRGQLRVALSQVQDRDAASALAGAWVLVPREALAELAEREYYRDDLVGCEVTNTDGVALGAVSHFVDVPAGAVMVVKGEREHWVPAQPPHLRRVELESRRVLVDWPAEL